MAKKYSTPSPGPPASPHTSHKSHAKIEENQILTKSICIFCHSR